MFPIQMNRIPNYEGLLFLPGSGMSGRTCGAANLAHLGESLVVVSFPLFPKLRTSQLNPCNFLGPQASNPSRLTPPQASPC